MKKRSIADPDMYLGNKLQQVKLANDVTCWSRSSSKYVQDAVSNMEDYLHMSMHGHTLPKNVYVPWLTDYCAELNTSLELLLDSKQANYYQLQIGVLHWIIELGQVFLVKLTSRQKCPCWHHRWHYCGKDILMQSSGS